MEDSSNVGVSCLAGNANVKFWISSNNIGAIYPGLYAARLACRSVFIGDGQNYGPFLYNPFELYAAKVLASPNIMVFGQIGFGKSAFVKALLSRHLQIGLRGCVLDPKGEYVPLSQAMGGSTFSFGKGPGMGLNPLESLATQHTNRNLLHRNRLEVLILVVGAIFRREVSSLEALVIEEVLREVESQNTRMDLFDIFTSIESYNWNSAGFQLFSKDAERCAALIALELRRYLFGDLLGVIDGPKNGDSQVIKLESFLEVDLFSSMGPESMRVGVPVFLSLLSKRLSQSNERYLIVLDEAWLALSSPGCIGFFRSYWKLARGYGISNIAVVHRSEDLMASGDGGSMNERIASGLVSDSQTFVIFHLDPIPARQVGQLLGLSELEIALIGTLPRGSALWRIAGETFLVDIKLTDADKVLFNTDQRMGS